MNDSGRVKDKPSTVNEEPIEESIKKNFRKLFHEWIFFQMKFIREEGLAIPQLFTLRYLYYNRPKDLSSVADFMGVSKPTVTGIMNTLERDGFIVRKRDSEDRRRIDLVLTDKSQDLFGRFESMTKFIVEDFVNSVSEDTLIKLDQSITNLIDKLGQAIADGYVDDKGETN